MKNTITTKSAGFGGWIAEVWEHAADSVFITGKIVYETRTHGTKAEAIEAARRWAVNQYQCRTGNLWSQQGRLRRGLFECDGFGDR